MVFVKQIIVCAFILKIFSKPYIFYGRCQRYFMMVVKVLMSIGSRARNSEASKDKKHKGMKHFKTCVSKKYFEVFHSNYRQVCSNNHSLSTKSKWSIKMIRYKKELRTDKNEWACGPGRSRWGGDTCSILGG